MIRRTAGDRRVTEDLDEVEDRVRSLLHHTRCMREAEERATPAVIIPLQPSKLRELTQALSCVICKGIDSQISADTVAINN